jgi:soluble lytic murein transglycosylase-like protein
VNTLSIEPSSLAQVLSRIQQLTPQPVQATQPAPPAPSFANVLAQASTPRRFASAATAATPASATSVAGDPSTAFRAAIADAGKRYGVDPGLLKAVIALESGFDPNATSGAGAQGLMQLMPSTAAALGVTNPYNPVQSINGGARYLREQLDRFGGNASLALAAYNAGPGAVEHFGGVPPYPETQRYVQQIMARYRTNAEVVQ